MMSLVLWRDNWKRQCCVIQVILLLGTQVTRREKEPEWSELKKRMALGIVIASG